MQEQPIFIVGTHRSGTTLLRLILNAHPQIAIPHEAEFLLPLLKRFKTTHKDTIEESYSEAFFDAMRSNRLFSRLFGKWRIQLADVEGKIRFLQGEKSIRKHISAFYMTYMDQHKKATWGDKTPSFFNMVRSFYALYPNARFIYLVRDGRDVMLSKRKYYTSQPDNVTYSAIEWLYKNRMILRQLNKIPKKMVIRYEDLVNHPNSTVEEICNFLSVGYSTEMMSFYQRSESQIGKRHSKLIFKPISNESVGKWRNELTRKETAVFDTIAKSLLSRFGYPVMSKSRSMIGNYCSIGYDLIKGGTFFVKKLAYRKTRESI